MSYDYPPQPHEFSDMSVTFPAAVDPGAIWVARSPNALVWVSRSKKHKRLPSKKIKPPVLDPRATRRADYAAHINRLTFLGKQAKMQHGRCFRRQAARAAWLPLVCIRGHYALYNDAKRSGLLITHLPRAARKYLTPAKTYIQDSKETAK